MQQTGFWSSLEAAFRARIEEARWLHATGDVVDMQARAADALVRLNAVRSDAEWPESVVAEALSHYEEALKIANVTPVVKWWVLIDDSKDSTRSEALKTEFRSLAARAAIGAELAGIGATPDEAWPAWLDELRRRESPFMKWGGHIIESVFEASALACHQLGTEALYQADASAKDSTPADVSPLRMLLEEAAWTVEQLAEAVEIDVRQVHRHLAGDCDPRPGSRKKYADAFSKRVGRTISPHSVFPRRPPASDVS